jgi:hypothetical protein
MYKDIESDLKFDRYGDLSFIGNDVETISSEEDILYQNIVDRLISNFGDYQLNRDFGADISGSIGRSNTASLESKVRQKVTRALTVDGFINPSDISVLTTRHNEKMLVRVDVIGGGLMLTDSFKVTAIYNTISGLFYATN